MKKLFSLILLAVFFITAGAHQGNDMKIISVGENQSLLRIHANENYLLFPVEESIDDSKIELLVNGKVEKVFYVRLANNKVDYYVPFDLIPYKGENLTFRVTTPKMHQPVRRSKRDSEHKELWIKRISLNDKFDKLNREQYRPVYHHTPSYGWMNDPNGMFYKDGEWHLYFQWNPYGSRWQNMTWGHSSSPDLVNWEQHDAAIEPNDLGTIFSGSAAIDRYNTAGFGTDAVVAMYTSAGDYQMQSLAFSHDNGKSFENYSDNPVITLPTEARDPNFFYNEKTGLWNLVLAHALEKEILIFSSPDLKQWKLESSFGKGLGAREGVWECPDLFELTVEGTDEKKWVMIVNLNPGGPFGGSATQYFVGDFDGKTFIPDTTPGGFVPTKWLDYGKDYYATVTWSDAPDNRRVGIAWMSNWQYADEVPTMQYRSANSLPRDLGLFRGKDGQIYVSSKPVKELLKLRRQPLSSLKNISVGKNGTSIELPDDGVCEITMNAVVKKSPLFLSLKNDAGEVVTIAYDPKSSTLSLDRTQSGVTDFSENFPAVTIAPTHETSGKLNLRIFIDKSSVEIFDADGKYSMTNLVFPSLPYTKLEITSDGSNARIENLMVYPLRNQNN